jgi:hypothetical protein
MANDWEIYAASAIGADHVRVRMPNQDGVKQQQLRHPDGTGVSVFAIADGHGHIRHFRSARGSSFAVSAACAVAGEWAPSLPVQGSPSSDSVSQLVTDIVARWREMVAADLASDPVSGADLTSLVPGDPPEIPYGSTLLIGVLTPQVAVLGQVGDGEILLVLPDGREFAPVPTDSRLDGTSTTSLCQPDAVSAFRVALVNLVKTPVFAVFASTDGYGNAQADENWRKTLAADMVRLGSEHGRSWLGGELQGWAEICASSQGSGDDSTVALALNSSVKPAPLSDRPHHRPPGGPASAADLAPTTEQPQSGQPLLPGASGRTLSREATTRQARQTRSTRPLTRPGQSPPRSGPPPASRQPAGPLPLAGVGRPAPAAILTRPQVWIPGVLFAGLALAAALIFASHNSSAKPVLPMTPGPSTLPGSRHSSPGVTATPTPRNTAGPTTPTPTSIPFTVPPVIRHLLTVTIPAPGALAPATPDQG